MANDQVSGVGFPAAADGRRSTATFGRAVVAEALRPVDPAGALAAEQEPDWRTQYGSHFGRLLESGLSSPESWLRIAATGLETVHGRMTLTLPDGSEAALTAALTEPATHTLETVTVTGRAEPGEFVLPYRGQQLRGDGIRDRLRRWVAEGTVEPSVADAVDDVLAHPEWLRLDGRTVAVLGAGAEMGPLAPLLSWGATVAAVDLPRSPGWERILAAATSGAGRLLVPVAPPSSGHTAPGHSAPGHSAPGHTDLDHSGLDHSDLDHTDLAARAGADLITDVPAIAEWLTSLPGPLVLGNYAYADGGGHVRVAAAVDALTQRLQKDHDDLALAFLATPTDVFATPAEAVQHSADAYRQRGTTARLLGAVSGHRLLHTAYPPGSDPGLCDSLFAIQGPNYALAKRIQRWRAAVARSTGTTVSFHVAPATRTRSVLKQRILKAVYAGAHHFGVEIFEPATANTLMAALLVHDLNTPPARHAHPWQDEAYQAAHGGLWRTAYTARSALGLAAVLGYPARSGAGSGPAPG